MADNTKIGFEKEIWDAACVLWGHIPAAEYRKVIVGLFFYVIYQVFLKNVSNNFLMKVMVSKMIRMHTQKKIYFMYQKMHAGIK